MNAVVCLHDEPYSLFSTIFSILGENASGIMLTADYE